MKLQLRDWNVSNRKKVLSGSLLLKLLKKKQRCHLYRYGLLFSVDQALIKNVLYYNSRTETSMVLCLVQNRHVKLFYGSCSFKNHISSFWKANNTENRGGTPKNVLNIILNILLKLSAVTFGKDMSLYQWCYKCSSFWTTEENWLTYLLKCLVWSFASFITVQKLYLSKGRNLTFPRIFKIVWALIVYLEWQSIMVNIRYNS